MILGQEQPDSGEIKVGDTVKIVSVGQERMDSLNSENTVFQEISEGLDELELGTQTVNSRSYLSWFGFKSAQQQAFVGNLSGGERNRVQLAKLVKAGGNFMILDEVRAGTDLELSRNHGLLRFAVRFCDAQTHLLNFSSMPLPHLPALQRPRRRSLAIAGGSPTQFCWLRHGCVARSILSGSCGNPYIGVRG